MLHRFIHSTSICCMPTMYEALSSHDGGLLALVGENPGVLPLTKRFKSPLSSHFVVIVVVVSSTHAFSLLVHHRRNLLSEHQPSPFIKPLVESFLPFVIFPFAFHQNVLCVFLHRKQGHLMLRDPLILTFPLNSLFLFFRRDPTQTLPIVVFPKL